MHVRSLAKGRARRSRYVGDTISSRVETGFLNPRTTDKNSEKKSPSLKRPDICDFEVTRQHFAVTFSTTSGSSHPHRGLSPPSCHRGGYLRSKSSRADIVFISNMRGRPLHHNRAMNVSRWKRGKALTGFARADELECSDRTRRSLT